MKRIINKTYSNFTIVVNAIQKEKHYSRSEAVELAHHVFEGLEANPGQTAKMVIDRIMPDEEYSEIYEGKVDT